MEGPQFYQAPSAFTSVSARRSLARYSPPRSSQPTTYAPSTPAPNAATEKAKRDWPPSVRAYVQRSFAQENREHTVDDKDMGERLKMIIGHSAESGTLTTLDWESMALPQQMIVQERMANLTMNSAPQNMSSQNPWQNGAPSFVPPYTNPKALESTSKKRKSSDMDPTYPVREKTPSWRQNTDRNVFEDRLSFPDKRQRQDAQVKPSKLDQKLANRKRRFDIGKPTTTYNHARSPTPEPDRGPVVGRCQTLEKKYFRLTSAPNPDTVRPLAILRQTLDFLRGKWNTDRNYSYICDQLKSLRQDLTVQHIKTDFTVKVYETHARIALEKGDLGEYNQCQTQLRALYAQGLSGNPEEFKAYRILYFIHTCNRTDMNDMLADLTPTEKKNKSIKNALAIRSALALGNYYQFFKLQLETPEMGGFLIEKFIGRERLVALSKICVTYKQEVSLRFVTDELGFGGDEESAQFICDYGGEDFLYKNDELGEIRLRSGKAMRFFEASRQAAFQKVDIKGQI